MSQGLMNRLFKMGAFKDKLWYRYLSNQYLSPTGAQATLFNDLRIQEQEREQMFARELKERETDDILDRAVLKAYNAKLSGVLPAAEYHRINEKV